MIYEGKTLGSTEGHSSIKMYNLRETPRVDDGKPLLILKECVSST